MTVYCHEFELKLHLGDVLLSLYIASAIVLSRLEPRAGSAAATTQTMSSLRARRGDRAFPLPLSASKVFLKLARFAVSP
jgi:hypothetical protein